MEGENIPNTDHVSRLCFRKFIDGDSIEASAFFPRPGVDEYLSVDWLEFLKCQNRDEEIIRLREVLSTRLKLRRKEKIAILNVGQMCGNVEANTRDNRKLEVKHEPRKNDDPHSGIYNVIEDYEVIGELIRQTILETYEAKP